jgi:hypothetical protein
MVVPACHCSSCMAIRTITWYAVVARLAERCHGVRADLRGYGDSSLPEAGANPSIYLRANARFRGPLARGKIDTRLAPNGAHGLDKNRRPGVYRGCI